MAPACPRNAGHACCMNAVCINAGGVNAVRGDIRDIADSGGC